MDPPVYFKKYQRIQITPLRENTSMLFIYFTPHFLVCFFFSVVDEDVNIRLLAPQEIGELNSWCTAEGWNIGLNSLETFYNAYPNGQFLAAEKDGEIVGEYLICLTSLLTHLTLLLLMLLLSETQGGKDF